MLNAFFRHSIKFRRTFCVVVLVNFALIFTLVFGWGSEAIAASVPSQQPIKEAIIHLGTKSGELKFEPDHLEFIAGNRYKLILDNPSNQKHYFTAKDFADIIWTQKVEAGNVEVKGAIHELEIRPGAIAEWVFIPQKTGNYEFHCSIAGHTEAGMQGIIEVKN